MKDTLTIGTIAGVLGTIVMHIFSMGFKAFDWITVTTLDYSVALFLNPDQAHTLPGTIVGFISHFMIGAAGGVLLAHYIKISGRDYYWLKGLALAAFMLLVGMGFVLNIMNLMPEMRADSMTVMLHFFAYAAYGITASYVIARLAKFELS